MAELGTPCLAAVESDRPWNTSGLEYDRPWNTSGREMPAAVTRAATVKYQQPRNISSRGEITNRDSARWHSPAVSGSDRAAVAAPTAIPVSSFLPSFLSSWPAPSPATRRPPHRRPRERNSPRRTVPRPAATLEGENRAVSPTEQGKSSPSADRNRVRPPSVRPRAVRSSPYARAPRHLRRTRRQEDAPSDAPARPSRGENGATPEGR